MKFHLRSAPKNFIKLHFKIYGTGTYRSGRQAKIKSQNSKRRMQKTLVPSISAVAMRVIAFRTQKTRGRGQNLLILEFKASNSRT